MTDAGPGDAPDDAVSAGRDGDADEGEHLKRVTARAIRRLDLLEYVVMFAAAVFALVGGGLVAWLLAATAELPFRPTWAVASVLLFVLPAALAWWTNREDRT